MPATTMNRLLIAADVGLVVMLTITRSTLAVADTGELIAARASCQAALLIEQRDPKVSSRAPCHRAFSLGAQAVDMRNEVASMMAPNRRPTLDEVVTASFLADAAVYKAADQPWGYLARCDIGQRLGLADVLEACLDDLRRVAPRHEETGRALARAGHAPPWVWGLRVLVVFALFGTLLHGAF